MIRKVLDYLFPSFTCLGCRGEINSSQYPRICDKCLSELEFAVPTAKGDVRTPFIYNGTIAKMILGLKYQSDGHVAETLAPFMRVIIKPKQYDFVVPVPLAKSRERERGYNQATLLAREVFQDELEIKQVLEKKKKTTPQVKMSTEERIANQSGAYMVNNPKDVKGKRILVIDDVITSGATTNEITRVLKENGAKKVHVLAIARVQS